MTNTDEQILDYFIGAPPCRVVLDTDDMKIALDVLQTAAHAAVTPGDGRLWVPGLALAVVVREDGACRVAYCDGMGLKNLDVSGSAQARLSGALATGVATVPRAEAATR
jgi:hypothetical protein